MSLSVKLPLPDKSQGSAPSYSVVNLDNYTRAVETAPDVSGHPCVKVFFLAHEDDAHTYALTLDEFLHLGPNTILRTVT